MSCVIVFLIAAWVVVSWGVYRAEVRAPGSNITSFGEGLWWGVVTLLTVGYGDRYPVTTVGRFLAGLLMTAGVGSVGIITAKISSYFLEQALREGRGHLDTSKLKDHFIVCGWKEEMHEILTHILDFNPGLTADQLVMIANMKPELVDELKGHPRLKSMRFVLGDYFHEVNLSRAAPERARKIMILADRAPNPNGQMPTMTEVDARTIMTAMTLQSIAKGTLVAAELLDAKMAPYLKIASVSEIIYTREYSRLLLGNASGGTGVANIIYDLLDPNTSSFLTTIPIPDLFFEKSYKELREDFHRNHPQINLIGILENSGNQARIKEIALRRAQQTTNVNQLLVNLKNVKELKCNQPVFNPVDEYIITEGSMAIVIEHRKNSGQTSNLKFDGYHEKKSAA